MTKPFICRIEPFLARPFINDYCDRWKIPYDKDVDYTYGNSVLWYGSFVKNSLEAVCGMYVDDNLPGELFLYGFYTSGGKLGPRACLPLIDLIVQLPYNSKYGYIVLDNLSMIRAAKKYKWDVLEEGVLVDGRPMVKAGIRGEVS